TTTTTTYLQQILDVDPTNNSSSPFPHHPLEANMVRTTMVARVSDGLPLAASMDDEQVRDRKQVLLGNKVGEDEKG
ncbi:hypothetical protein BC936DRAFT_147647, partial [Jimgerdemannia flammicorona]